jgi:hypothetical protein
MSTAKRSVVEELDALIDAYLEDLQEVPEADLLGDPNQVEMQRANFDKLVKSATAEAGKRRLALAKRALAAKSGNPMPLEPIDLAEARRYIAEAANDARITLAARDLVEMPDEEVERIYRQLKELDSARSPRKD